MKAIRRALRKDNVFKKYKVILENASQLGEFDNYVSELENMHKGRYARQLVHKKISTKRIIKAALQDGAYRARCVEIMVQVNKAHRMLSATTDTTYNHILVEYKQYLSAYRTKAERDSYVTSILKEAHEKLSDFERILDMCKLIIEDIDKFSWSTKNIVEALKLVIMREQGVGLKGGSI